MRHDTIGLMSEPTATETARAMRSVRHVTLGYKDSHTPESFALDASMPDARSLAGREANWAAALVRMERSENARPDDASPVTTIDRVRQLVVDVELQAYARTLAESRHEGRDVPAKVVMPLDREMGRTWAGDMRSRMRQMSTESLDEFGSGKGVTNAHDAVLMGSTLTNVLDAHRTGDIDTMTAERFGIERTRGIRDRIAGRSEEDVRWAAPAEERARMMEIEDAAGVARGRGEASTVAPRVGRAEGYHLAIHGTERHTADFLEGGERLEQRIAIEKAMLRKLDDRKLASTFLEVMPTGSIPENAADRDRWIETALRNERLLVGSGVAPIYQNARAIMRDRGPIPEGPERDMPTGAFHSAAFQDSMKISENLERASDKMLRGRFGKAYGMDEMPIPQEPDKRRNWIHQASMLNIAAEHEPSLAPARTTPGPQLGVAPERQTGITVHRPAALAAMVEAGRTR